MEYSSDDIAAAMSLQFCTYIYVSMATFWCYDYICSLHEEWTYLLRSDGRKVKCLYILTRGLPFTLLATILYQYFIPNETPDKCRMLANVDSAIVTLSAICSEAFFVLRTCALWNNNKILIAVMLSTFLVSSQSTHYTKASGRCISQTFVGASIGVSFTTTGPAACLCPISTLAIHYHSTMLSTFTDATSAIPGITGCYQSSTSLRLFIPFLLLSAFELALMILTLIRAIQNWQIYPSHLYGVLVKHNIFYYICGFVFSVANILTSLLLHYSYNDILHIFQFMILAILATRMHLDLWQMNQRVHSSAVLARIRMSDIVSA
ncbi:hypothetical protein BDR04DRAFT_1158148 [Suillus decipiens]|nr:hypothetical protein BDR04DRAFT_1158148 [Suillus decipiens]